MLHTKVVHGTWKVFTSLLPNFFLYTVYEDKILFREQSIYYVYEAYKT